MDDWITATSALIAALIAAAVIIFNGSIERRAASRAQAETDQRRAIQQVLHQSQALDLCTHQVLAVAVMNGSLDGRLSRAIGATVPLDPMAMFERLNQVTDALTIAAIEVEIAADAATRDLVDDVMAAAMSVVTAHMSTSGNPLRTAAGALLGRRTPDAEILKSARDELHERRDALADHVRTQGPGRSPKARLHQSLSRR